MIPYGRQNISEEDIEAVIGVLKSDFLTQGPMVPAFEEAIAKACGANHAIATTNATSALHIACLALGVGDQSLVWTSPISFVASSNCALYCGAEVDFVDIDPGTTNMCPKALEAKLIEADKAGRLPDVVIPVHMAGQSCDMAAIHALSQRYGFRIIEDASHAVGADYKGRPVGTCDYSDIAIFSFHPVKIITTGEGGMALTADADLAQKMELLRSHGITRDAALMEEKNPEPWVYEQQALGFNYRMTDMQAALGLSQSRRLAEWVATRRHIAKRYDEALASLDIGLPQQIDDSASSWHLYLIRVPERGNRNRGTVFDTLRSRGVGVNVHYIPIYHQPYYRELGFKPGYCPEAEAYYREAITLPLHPGLSDEDFDHIVKSLAEALEG